MAHRLDHILTFANVPNIDAYVSDYRRLGFLVNEDTFHYRPGLRNRFIQFGCEYLELLWVENEAEFAAGGNEEFARMFPDLPVFRQAARPFSVAFHTANVEALHQQWTARGYQLPEVWSFAPPNTPPILSFQTIPDEYLPGASCFAITYHLNSSAIPEVRHVQSAPNTTYAVEGISFVSATPQENATRWQNLLTPDSPIYQEANAYRVAIPPHTVWWMSPQVYQERYGLEYAPSLHRYGNIADVHLFAENLKAAVSHLGQSARQIINPNQEPILVVPSIGNDGVTFIIREYPIEKWRAERSVVTGEDIVLL